MISFKNLKLLSAIGIGLVSWSVLSKAFAAIPVVPTLITKPLIGGISILVVGAGFAAYGIVILYSKY